MASPNALSGPDPAFQALVRARYAGNPCAMTALGLRLLAGRDSPWSPVDGATLIAEAAKQGDPEAWNRLAVLAALGAGREQSWADALDALARAVELGNQHARRQASLLRDLGASGIDELRDWISIGESPANTRVLLESPRFVLRFGILTPALCSYLIESAAPKLAPARVYDAARGGLKLDEMRTNTIAPFSLIHSDLITQVIRARLASAAHVAFDVLDPPDVLHYAVSEFVRRHVDFFHPSLPDYEDEMRLRGQRVKTCLVYLNDDYEGGETHFPELDLKVRGGAGDALIFDSVLADGSGAMSTVHAGLAPTRGEKWVFQQWIRTKPQYAS